MKEVFRSYKKKKLLKQDKFVDGVMNVLTILSKKWTHITFSLLFLLAVGFVIWGITSYSDKKKDEVLAKMDTSLRSLGKYEETKSRDDYLGAESGFNSVVKNDKRLRPIALFYLSYLYAISGNGDYAINVAREAISETKNDIMRKLLLVWLLELQTAQRKCNEAINTWDEILYSDAKKFISPKIYYDIASCLQEQEQAQERVTEIINDLSSIYTIFSMSSPSMSKYILALRNYVESLR